MEDLAVVALGCLLHDIGKIVQRADETPLRQGHSRFGADLIQSAGLLKESKYWSFIFESLRYHHLKYLKEGTHTHLSAGIACEADRISSQTSARDADGYVLEETEYPADFKWDRHRKLSSVFVLLQTANGKEPPHAYFPLALIEGRRVTLQRCPYPEESKSEERASECYSHMRDLAVSPMVAYLQGRDPRSTKLVNEVSRYLEHHLSFVPADCAADSPCFISLYDHMTLNSAVGSALYSLLKELHPETLSADNKDLPQDEAHKKSPLFLVLTAGIQGSRSFIFDGAGHTQHRTRRTGATSVCASSAMKSRARYLELFRQWIAEQFLRACGLPRNNLLLSSGSQFTLLLPNTPQTLAMAARMQARINEWLLHSFGGLIHLVLDCTEATESDLSSPYCDKGNRKALFDLSTEKMQSAKEPFRGLLKSVFADRQQNQLCTTCGSDTTTTVARSDSGICIACAAVQFVESSGKDAIDTMLTAPCLITGTAATGGIFPIWNQETARFESGVLALHSQDDALLATFARSVPSPKSKTRASGPLGVMHARITQPPGSSSITDALQHSFQRELSLRRHIERFLHNCMDDFQTEKDPAQFDQIERIISSTEDLVFSGPADKLIDFAIHFQQRLHKFSSGTLTLSCGIAITRNTDHKDIAGKLANKAEELDRATSSGMCVDFDLDSPGGTRVQTVNWHDWRREVRPLMHDLQRIKSRSSAITPLANRLLSFVLDSGSSFYQLLYAVARVDEQAPDLQDDPLWQRFKRHRLLPMGSRSAEPRQRHILAAALLWVELTQKTKKTIASPVSNAGSDESASDAEPPMVAEEEPDTLTVGGG